jgi:hypothetical protein
MDTGIHVGPKINAHEAVGPLSEALVKVLAAIATNHIDRETGVKALEILGMSAGVQHTTISHCHIEAGSND